MSFKKTVDTSRLNFKDRCPVFRYPEDCLVESDVFQAIIDFVVVDQFRTYLNCMLDL